MLELFGVRAPLTCSRPKSRECRPPQRSWGGDVAGLGALLTVVRVVAAGLTVLTLHACSPERSGESVVVEADLEAVDVRSAASTVDSLSSRIISSPTVIDRPWMIGVHRDVVVVSDLDPPYVHILDRLTGRHIRSFGAHGEGPGEFSNGPSILRTSLRTDTLWVLDGPQQRLTGIPIQSLAGSSMQITGRTVMISPIGAHSADGPTTQGRFIITEDDRESGVRLYEVDADSGKIRASAMVPLGDTRPSPAFRGSAYSGRVCLAGNRNDLYLAYRYAGRIDHLSSTAQPLVPVKVPFGWLPYVSVDTLDRKLTTFGASRPLARRSYNDCGVTDLHLYATYSGRRYGRPRNPHPLSELHVFDGTGRLTHVYVLDHIAMTFAVSADDRELYSVSEDSAGFVVRITQLRR